MTTKKPEINSYTMYVLRQRLNLEEDDTSMDEHIMSSEKFDNFRELVAWHIGDPAWAFEILMWMRDVGFDLSTLELPTRMKEILK
jgi:hypothetical protein